jgi:hypothetical protein
MILIGTRVIVTQTYSTDLEDPDYERGPTTGKTGILIKPSSPITTDENGRYAYLIKFDDEDVEQYNNDQGNFLYRRGDIQILELKEDEDGNYY